MHQLTSIKPELPVADGAPKVDAGEPAESSGDELPTLEKTAPRRQRSTDRYSNLPRRQTSYRIAKNLDAVSRKAMMMWEMSEVYSEQTSNRRKKVSRLVGACRYVSFSTQKGLQIPLAGRKACCHSAGLFAWDVIINLDALIG